MLPETTYLLRFMKRDRSVEWFEHTNLEDAKQHFDMFDDTDADIYSEIALVSREWMNVSMFNRKWTSRTDTVLERKCFV